MKVRLRSNEPSAAEATDATLKMLPMNGGAHLERDGEGRIQFDARGLANILTSNERFVKFAVLNQGYVAEVVD